MWRTVYTITWLFVFLVAGYDASFAWANRASFQDWECNPLACWAAGALGIQALFGLKFGTLTLAAALAIHCHASRKQLARLLTAIAASAHGLLSLYYVVGSRDSTLELLMSCVTSIVAK